jgi:hypothetical protein
VHYKKKLTKQPRLLKLTCHSTDVKNNSLYTTASADCAGLHKHLKNSPSDFTGKSNSWERIMA